MDADLDPADSLASSDDESEGELVNDSGSQDSDDEPAKNDNEGAAYRSAESPKSVASFENNSMDQVASSEGDVSMTSKDADENERLERLAREMAASGSDESMDTQDSLVAKDSTPVNDDEDDDDEVCLVDKDRETPEETKAIVDAAPSKASEYEESPMSPTPSSDNNKISSPNDDDGEFHADSEDEVSRPPAAMGNDNAVLHLVKPATNALANGKTAADEKDSMRDVEDQGELDFEEEIAEEKKEDDNLEDGEKVAENDKENEEDNEKDDEDYDDGEVEDDDDLEEGEVKDSTSSRKPQVRPVCRFFNKGQCTWGSSCRFIHPGVNDKGNYNMFAPSKPLVPSNGPGHAGAHPGIPAGPPRGYPGFARGPPDMVIPPPPVDEGPPVESAWERGLRHAKEIMKKANKRKEMEPDFEEKRFNLTLGAADTNLEYEKENDNFFGRSPYYKSNDPLYIYGYDDPDPFERQAQESWRGGNYENFEVRYLRTDFDARNKEKEKPKERSRKEKYERAHNQDHNWRENRFAEIQGGGVRSRGDEWKDPWRRSTSPKRRNRSKSYSSASSASSYSSGSSRSRSSSYTSYSRSSSASTYSSCSSHSYPKARSRNKAAQQRKNKSSANSTAPVGGSSGGGQRKRRSTQAAPAPVQNQPPPPPKVARPPPEKKPQPAPMIPPQLIPLPPSRGEAPEQQQQQKKKKQPVAEKAPAPSSNVAASKSGTTRQKRARSPSPSGSGSGSSRSSYSGSSSRSSVSSRSSSRSSSASSLSDKGSKANGVRKKDKLGKRPSKPRPAAKGREPRSGPAKKYPHERSKNVPDKKQQQHAPHQVAVGFDFKASLNAAARSSKDPLKQSGQKPQIKLTLLNKHPPDKANPSLALRKDINVLSKGKPAVLNKDLKAAAAMKPPTSKTTKHPTTADRSDSKAVNPSKSASTTNPEYLSRTAKATPQAVGSSSNSSSSNATTTNNSNNKKKLLPTLTSPPKAYGSKVNVLPNSTGSKGSQQGSSAGAGGGSTSGALPPSTAAPAAAASAAASASANANKKNTVSRREELLKQLKAVEDAIARKRAKLT